MKTITAKCKPFKDYPTGIYVLRIDDDKTIRVYDRLAGCFTLCHSLTRQTQQRILRNAS